MVAETTPRRVIDPVVQSACGRKVERLVPIAGGGLNEVYRAETQDNLSVVVRIARRPEPWFTREASAISKARDAGVPAPEVLGVEQVDHDGELLSFSILQLLPGRPLGEIVGELSPAELERLVVESGELLARVHGVAPNGGKPHALEPPEASMVERMVAVAAEALGPEAAGVVERGVAFLRHEVRTREAPRLALTHGDWLPKHFLIGDRGTIVGVIDWEFAGPAPPAFDLAHWEVAAGDALQDRSDLLRRGYARVADPDAADAGWSAAFAIHFALDILGWRKPASPARLQRCVEVIARRLGS